MTDLVVLASELTDDPLTRGYSGMTDLAAAQSLNAEDRILNRKTMTGKEVKDKIATADWNSRTNAQKQILLALFARDDLNPHGIDAQIFTDAMSGHTGGTVAKLAAERDYTTSRAAEIGLGRVSEGDVNHARNL